MDASDSKSPFAAGLRWTRGHARSLGIVAGLLLLYALAGFLLLPHLARSAITSYAERDLGRRISIGALRFNPFTFTAEIRQLVLSEPDGSPLVSFRLLRIAASASSLPHWAWAFREVRLEQPIVNVLVGRDGSLNLAELMPAKAPAAPRRPAPASWPRVRIAALTVSEGSLHFEDRSRGTPFTDTLSPIELSLHDFRTTVNFESPYRFSALTSAGERLDWSGDLSVQPLGSSGQFAITGLKASTVAAYLQDALPFALRSGSLELLGDYRLITAAGSHLSLNLRSLKLHELAIAPKATPAAAGPDAAAAAVPWISLPELDVADTSIALPERRIAIGEVTLHDAALELWREPDGSLNLRRLWPAAGGAPRTSIGAESESIPATPAWTVALARLSIDRAAVDIEDRSVKPAVKLHLGPIAFAMRNYSSAGVEPLSFDLTTGVGQAGQLRGSGTLALTPLHASVKIDLRQFDLTALQPYAAQKTDMTIYRGNLAAQGQLVYAGTPAKGQPGLRFTGTLGVTDFATRDNVMNADFITWRSLQVNGLRYQQAPDALSIERVQSRGAYGRVIIGADGKLNITDILRPLRTRPASAPAAKTAERGPATRSATAATTARADASSYAGASAAMPIRIGRVEIENGAADFSDHSVQPNFSSAILGLRGTVVGLSSAPASRAQVQIRGSVDRYAPVSITGQINLLSPAVYTDLRLTFSNIELSTFNPYSGKFAGYSIAQGKLTTEMHYHVENRRLQATHHIVIDQLEFGPATASKQAVPLPIKLAAALLKDRHGVISIDLPVNGSLDDPSFRVGPIIWKMFTGLVRKIVTAPFAWLGSLFGGGAQLAYIDFPAGSATLDTGAAQKLSQLSKALTERPQLKLDIPLHTISVVDDRALANAALEQALSAINVAGDKRAAVHAATHSGKGPRIVAATGAGAGAGAGAARATTAPAGPSPRLRALTAVYQQKFQAAPVYPSALGTQDARSAWLEQQLLARFIPNREQRAELERARADAVEAAVLADRTLPPERVFLTQRESGGGAAGAVRMELQLQ